MNYLINKLKIKNIKCKICRVTMSDGVTDESQSLSVRLSPIGAIEKVCDLPVTITTPSSLPVSIKFDDMWLLYAGCAARRVVNPGSWGARGVQAFLMFQSDDVPIHTGHLDFRVTDLTRNPFLSRHFVLRRRFYFVENGLWTTITILSLEYTNGSPHIHAEAV